MLPRNPSTSPVPPYQAPFAVGGPFRDFQPYNGGVIRIVAGPLNATTDITTNHTLRRIPNAIEVLDAGQSFKPKTKRATTAWDNTKVVYQLDTAIGGADSLTLLIR